MLSQDDGETWSRPVELGLFGVDNVDGGYPASVELDSGEIVTAYYSQGCEYHNRYHVGIMKWRLEEFFKNISK